MKHDRIALGPQTLSRTLWLFDQMNKMGYTWGGSAPTPAVVAALHGRFGLGEVWYLFRFDTELFNGLLNNPGSGYLLMNSTTQFVNHIKAWRATEMLPF